jgi:hypothetical protein
VKEREQRNGRSVRNQFAGISVRTRIVKIKIKIQSGEEIEMRVRIKAE